MKIDITLVIVAVFFVLGIILAIVAPNPITVGCAIFNGIGLGMNIGMSLTKS